MLSQTVQGWSLICRHWHCTKYHPALEECTTFLTPQAQLDYWNGAHYMLSEQSWGGERGNLYISRVLDDALWNSRPYGAFFLTHVSSTRYIAVSSCLEWADGDGGRLPGLKRHWMCKAVIYMYMQAIHRSNTWYLSVLMKNKFPTVLYTSTSVVLSTVEKAPCIPDPVW